MRLTWAVALQGLVMNASMLHDHALDLEAEIVRAILLRSCIPRRSMSWQKATCYMTDLQSV
jgi:hypothetical protein